ncbi:putative CST complex subunit STN1 protein, partial [Naja naja]
TDSKASPCSRLIRKSFMEAITLLQNDGVLFQKSKASQNMYYVTEQNTELHKVTLEVIRADCKRPKYAEKGCHLRHIHNCIQQSYNPYITEAVVRCLLDWLEINSEVSFNLREWKPGAKLYYSLIHNITDFTMYLLSYFSNLE